MDRVMCFICIVRYETFTFSLEGEIISDDICLVIANLCKEVVLVSCILYSMVCPFKEQSKVQASSMKLEISRTLQHKNLPTEGIAAVPQTVMNLAQLVTLLQAITRREQSFIQIATSEKNKICLPSLKNSRLYLCYQVAMLCRASGYGNQMSTLYVFGGFTLDYPCLVPVNWQLISPRNAVAALDPSLLSESGIQVHLHCNVKKRED